MEAHRQVRAFVKALQDSSAGILNLHPAFASVLIDFDPRRVSHQQMEALVCEQMAAPPEAAPWETRTVKVPVSYGGAFGPDLDDVARHAGLTPAHVVELHASASYLVYFLGFSPGF